MKTVRVGVEAGGTTFKAAFVVDKSSSTALYNVNDIIHVEKFATTEPNETLPNVTNWIRTTLNEKGYTLSHLGIACFGPLDLNKSSPTYGFITTAPKLKWQQCNILGHMKRAFPELSDNQFSLDTDVNAPAQSEVVLHNSKNAGHIGSLAYITVGTGIGVGLVVNEKTVHGLMHPEGGHFYTPIHELDIKDGFTKGTCPFHGNCAEGMASAGAIAARKGIANADISQIDDNDDVWDRVAFYLAHICVTISLLTSAERVVIGGGVIRRGVLLSKVQQTFKQLVNGYVSHKYLSESPELYIGASEHGEHSGIIGALSLN